MSDDIEVLFCPSCSQVSVNIKLLADIYPEANETFDVTIIIPPAMKEIGVKNGNISKANGIIINDDSKVYHISTCFTYYVL